MLGRKRLKRVPASPPPQCGPGYEFAQSLPGPRCCPPVSALVSEFVHSQRCMLLPRLTELSRPANKTRYSRNLATASVDIIYSTPCMEVHCFATFGDSLTSLESGEMDIPIPRKITGICMHTLVRTQMWPRARPGLQSASYRQSARAHRHFLLSPDAARLEAFVCCDGGVIRITHNVVKVVNDHGARRLQVDTKVCDQLPLLICDQAVHRYEHTIPGIQELCDCCIVNCPAKVCTS